ncbi:uncharacterized protein LOC111126616 [Crassostrea virginica]
MKFCYFDVVLAAILFCIVAKTASCPPPCRCHQNLYTYCDDAALTSNNLEDVLLNTPATTIYLDLSLNSINYLPSEIFDNHPQLTNVNFAKNSIGSISSKVFVPLTHLRKLFLEENKIVVINSGLFTSQEKLEILRLDRNKIEHIHNTSFENLVSLEELYLGDNHLYEIPSLLFTNTTKLRVLDLSDNLIEYIHDGTFAHLRNLEILSLANNRIRTLQSYSLNGLINLKQLSLRRNRLSVLQTTDLDAVRFSLKELDLSSNSLSTLTSNMFSNMPKLLNLNISGNNIELINDSAFFGLSLDKLLLNGNKLTKVWRSSFRGVQRFAYLDFSRNEISRVETGAFDSFNEFIFVLDLSENKLTKLHYGMVREMKYLQVLRLAHNEIDQVVNTALKDLANLQELDISKNKFTAIDSKDFVGPLNSLKLFSLQCNTLIRFENFNFNKGIQVSMNLTQSHVRARSVNVSWPFTKGRQLYWSMTIKCVDSNQCPFDSKPQYLPAYKESHVIDKMLPISQYYVCINPVFANTDVKVEQCLFIMTSEEVITTTRSSSTVVNSLGTSGASPRTSSCAILSLIYFIFTCFCWN